MVNGLISMAFMLACVILLMARSRHLASTVPAQQDPNALSAIHWGLLNGGRSRAALAAFTQWIVDGVVVWNEAEKHYEADDSETDDRALVLVNAGAPLSEILKAMEQNGVPYERQLQRWGLWCEDHLWEKRTRNLLVAWRVYASGILIYSFWEMWRDKVTPGFLTFVVFSGLQFKRKPPQNTREGQRLLKQFKRQHPFKIGQTPEALLPTAVAIDGVNALYDSNHEPLIWLVAIQT